MLAQRFEFDGETLRSAIDETLRRRNTLITIEVPDALRPEFYRDAARARLWEAFLKKTRSEIEVPGGFEELGMRVRAFLEPVRESLVGEEVFVHVWPKGGGWRIQVLGGRE